jgi:hypothetical protein
MAAPTIKRQEPQENPDAILLTAIRARHAQAEKDAMAALKDRDPVAHSRHVRLANALAGVLRELS